MTFEADRKDLQNGDILQDGKIVGGIISVFRDWKNEGQVDNHYKPLFPQYELTSPMILDALEKVGAPGNRESFDCMLESSPSADCEVWFGNPEEEYKHFIFVFEDGLMDLWFDLGLVDTAQAREIATNFSVDQ